MPRTGPAATVAELYRRRWRIELFFQVDQATPAYQGLYGTSENVVRGQIWIAVSVYILIAIIKKRLHLDASLYTILQVLSLPSSKEPP